MSGPVHFIAQFDIDDADVYRAYEKGFFPVLKQYGGEFVTFDDDVTVLEGDKPSDRTVILRFPDEDACLTWWNSPEYREIAPHRHAGTTSRFVGIVKPPPAR